LTPAQISDHVSASSTALAKIMPGSDPITVTTLDFQQWSVQPTLPVALQCPYSAGRNLPAAIQRKAAADSRCAPEALDSTSNLLSPLVTDDPNVVAAVLGLSGTELGDAIAALRQGRALVTDPRYVSHGQVTLGIGKNDGSGTPRSVVVPAVTAGSTSLMTTIVLPPGDLATVGVPTRIFGVVATPTAPPSQAQKDAIQAQATNNGVDLAYTESGPPHDNVDIALILAIAAGVIALGAAAIATGLAAVDGRDDLRTLGAIGATPRVRRLLALAQSGVIAGLGSLLGAAAGLGAGAAVLFGLNQVYAGTWPAPVPYPIPIPWLNLGVSVLVVPLVAMLGAGLLTRSRLPSERRAD
jgi:putative ABC transport system permease protein